MTTSVLLLTADPPDPDALGGVSVHVAALARDAATTVTVHTAHPSGDALRVERWGPRALVAILPLRSFGHADDTALESALTATLTGTKADVLHVHSPLLGPRAIASAARRTSTCVALTLHDHALVCESYDLLEGGERFCGIPEDETRCDRCLGMTHHRPAGSVRVHREAMRELGRAADAIVAPSNSVLALVRRVHPDVAMRARRLDWGVPAPRVRSARSAVEEGPLSIAIVGALSHEKGRRRLPDLLSACRELDVTWHLFGATDGASIRDLRASAPRVVLHGAYHRSALAERLVRAGCHLALFPSIKPESFSLALSEVTAAGLPVIASNLGALAERVESQGLGWTFDPWVPATLSAVVADLASHRSRIDDAARRVRALPLRTEVAVAADHVALWTELAGRPREPRGAAESDVRAAWVHGVELGAKIREAPLAGLARAVAMLRHTDFYRDLPLRRLLPEATRKTVERAVTKLLAGRGAR